MLNSVCSDSERQYVAFDVQAYIQKGFTREDAIEAMWKDILQMEKALIKNNYIVALTQECSDIYVLEFGSYDIVEPIWMDTEDANDLLSAHVIRMDGDGDGD